MQLDPLQPPRRSINLATPDFLSSVGTAVGGRSFALKQAELGTKVDEICRKIGISDATFYKWRQKYGGLGPSELRRLRQLEEENFKLKRLVADLALDKAMLQDVLAKKL